MNWISESLLPANNGFEHRSHRKKSNCLKSYLNWPPSIGQGLALRFSTQTLWWKFLIVKALVWPLSSSCPLHGPGQQFGDMLVNSFFHLKAAKTTGLRVAHHKVKGPMRSESRIRCECVKIDWAHGCPQINTIGVRLIALPAQIHFVLQVAWRFRIDAPGRITKGYL